MDDRQKLWVDVLLASHVEDEKSVDDATRVADEVLARYDERWPKRTGIYSEDFQEMVLQWGSQRNQAVAKPAVEPLPAVVPETPEEAQRNRLINSLPEEAKA